MKQFKLATLAAASLLASGFAGAGTLQVTPIQYASETVASGAVITAPVFSYSLAAPVSTTSSPVFTAEFKLSNALWAGGINLPALADIVMVSPDSTTSVAAKAVALNAAGDTLIVTFKVVDAVNGPTELPAAITAGNGGGALGAAGYTFPIGTNIIVGRTLSPKVVGTAAMVAPSNSCTDVTADTVISVVVKNAIGIVTETAAPLNVLDNSVYLRSSNALKVVAEATTALAETSRIDVFVGSLSKQFTADLAGATPAGDVNVINIGRVVFSDRGAYTDATSVPAAPYTVATAFATTGSATPVAGNVSVDKLTLRVTGAFNTAGTVYLSSLQTCLDEINLTTGAAAALATGVAASATSRAALLAGSATFTAAQILSASWPVLGGKATAYVCYKRDVTNATTLMPSQFAIDASVSAVSHLAGESGSPVCGLNLYNLVQNGVRFDLRNVIGKQSQAYTDGWRSFVRIINTDETQSAAVTAQVITSGGTVLAGKIITTTAIPPRGYIMMSTDAIETALAGSASAGYVDAAGVNTRIRLTAPTASLRAQNYVYSPLNNTFIEASGSQGDEQPGLLPAVNPNVLEDARK